MTLFALCLLAAIGWGTLPPSPPPEAFNRKVRTLAQQLTSDDAKRRERAEEELLALGPEAAAPLLLMVKNADPAQLEAIRSILPKYGPAAVEGLYRAVLRASLERALEDEVVRAVAKIGASALPEVDRLLDSEPFFRSFAIGVLREMGPAGLPHLVRLLEHPDHEVRASAATLLGSVADPRATDALLAALQGEDPTVWGAAADGLGSLGDRRAMERLLHLTEAANVGTRESVVVALGRMYERRLLGVLVQVARHDVAVSVRAAATSALITRSHDRVAIRLGRRYKPPDTDPMSQGTIQLASVMRLLLTGLALYGLLWAGVKFSSGAGWRGVPRSVWWGAAGVAAVGFVWSRVVVGINGLDEWLVLLVAAPAALFLAWFAVSGLRVLLVPALSVVLVMVGVLPLASYLYNTTRDVRVLVVLAWAVAPGLLVLSVIAALVLEWRRGRRADRAVRAPMRRAARLGALGFYAGYGIGWLALWGYLGF